MPKLSIAANHEEAAGVMPSKIRSNKDFDADHPGSFSRSMSDFNVDNFSKTITCPLPVMMPDIIHHDLLYYESVTSKKERKMEKFAPYSPLQVLGKGTYGIVYKSRDEAGRPVAMKFVRLPQDTAGIPQNILREVSLLKEIQHENVIQLLGVRSNDNNLVLIFELAVCDLWRFQNIMKQPLSARRVKSFMYQLLQAVAYVHKFQVLHRDLKPQNLLLLEDGTLKVADFGLARAFSVPVRAFRHEVVTLWYRPPDVLLGNQNYTTGVDIWSVGCIFAEMIEYAPLFAGTSVEDHIDKIFQVFGTPPPEIFPNHERYVASKLIDDLPKYPKKNLADLLPHACPDAIDLLEQLLVYDGEKRLSAVAALQHPYFTRAPFEKKVPLNMHLLERQSKVYMQRKQYSKVISKIDV